MPRNAPPWPNLVAPRHRLVPAGSMLWTVSRRGQPLFRPAPAEHGPTGRFDPRESGYPDPRQYFYPYCYAATDDLTAIAEVLLRDVGYDAEGRALPSSVLSGRRLKAIEPLRTLTLISLVSAVELAAARQDTWLVHAEPDEYRDTRLWAQWLRDCSKQADGIIWTSKRCPDGQAITLFGDRCGDDVIESPFGGRDLDEPGREWINRRLGALCTYVVAKEEA